MPGMPVDGGNTVEVAAGVACPVVKGTPATYIYTSSDSARTTEELILFCFHILLGDGDPLTNMIHPGRFLVGHMRLTQKIEIG